MLFRCLCRAKNILSVKKVYACQGAKLQCYCPEFVFSNPLFEFSNSVFEFNDSRFEFNDLKFGFADAKFDCADAGFGYALCKCLLLLIF